MSLINLLSERLNIRITLNLTRLRYIPKYNKFNIFLCLSIFSVLLLFLTPDVEMADAQSSNAKKSGYDKGCADAKISDVSSRYINQLEKGFEYHTDEFNSGYDQGFSKCAADAYESGYDKGCADAKISDVSSRYINQPQRGPAYHTDEFNSGYDQGFSKCYSGPIGEKIKNMQIGVLYKFQFKPYQESIQNPEFCAFTKLVDLGCGPRPVFTFSEMRVGEDYTICMRYKSENVPYEACQVNVLGQPKNIHQPYAVTTINIPNQGPLKKCSGDTTVASHFRMNACVTVNPTGEYNFRVKTWNDNHNFGFTGGFIAYFLDQDGNMINSIPPKEYGLNACYTNYLGRSDCPDRVDVDPSGIESIGKDSYNKLSDIEIDLSYAPKGWQERLEENLRSLNRTATEAKESFEKTTGIKWTTLENSTIGKWAGDVLEAGLGCRSSAECMTFEKPCIVPFVIPLGGVPIPGCVNVKGDFTQAKLNKLIQADVTILGTKIDDVTLKQDHIRVGFFVDLDKTLNEITGIDLSSLIQEYLGKNDKDIATADIVVRANWEKETVETTVETCYKVPELKKGLTGSQIMDTESVGDVTNLEKKCDTSNFST